MNINLKLKDYINKALEELNFKKYTLIQEKVIPLAINNKNIIGKSKTGSGKTHSFLIPLFQNLDEKLQQTQFLIILPTAEIARQTFDFCNQISKFCDVKINIKLYIGGINNDKEIIKIKNNPPQIVIGTPGKLDDLVNKRNVLQIQNVKTVVLDEADMVLETGFLKEVDLLINKIKKPNFLIFSATLPPQIKAFLKKLYKNNHFLEIEGEDYKTLNIKHYLTKYSDEYDKLNKFNNIIDNINPYLCLIFCNKKEDIENVYKIILEKKKDVISLSKDTPLRKRKSVLRNIKDLKYQFVICSDVASRGIDIPGVTHIINYDIPNDLNFYFHRTGRTGRNNLDGICYNLYTYQDETKIKKLKEKQINFINLRVTKKELIEV